MVAPPAAIVAAGVDEAGADDATAAIMGVAVPSQVAGASALLDGALRLPALVQEAAERPLQPFETVPHLVPAPSKLRVSAEEARLGAEVPATAFVPSGVPTPAILQVVARVGRPSSEGVGGTNETQDGVRA